ncbi:MAG: hypothetical protein SWJ54_18325 [Cyanobacteriota bacterium]|nr:hypothetical protein [Cyanobacteriota bacterium]
MFTNLFVLLLFFLGSGLLFPAIAQPSTVSCMIDESETNDYSFQLFNCNYSRSQIDKERIGFQFSTNLGVLIILKAQSGADVIMPSPDKVNTLVQTSWVVERAEKYNGVMELTLYNQETGKTVKIDVSF